MPTEGVDGIMTLWRNEWTRDRAEWEERRKGLLATDMELRRSRTHDGRRRTSSPPPRGDPGGGPDLGLVRRNNSLPTNACQASRGSASSSAVGGTNRNYKYGRPPSLPRSDEPNPMVRRSSKMINKKHARYALCAGMMLGIRESVGGALGVEAELEISNWEGCERSWGEGCREGEDDDDEGGEVVLLDGLKSDVGGGGGGVGDDVSRPSSSPSSSPSRRRRYNDPPSSRDNAAVAAALTAECERVAKYKFPPHQFYLGSNTSSPLPHKYKFKVYAPLVFARIRSLFGVEKQTFLHSICGKFNFYEFASNARSGQFFFYSHDGRYMIKTLTFAESKFLREILPFYYRHLTRFPSTFLTHFYGMFRVCMPDANNQLLHFVIMRSVFHTKKKISRVWDLKGSTANRKSEPGDSVGKDLDMLEEGRKLRFADPGARGAFLEQLRRDATFLARLGIMDYSLLLGLHNCEEEREGDVGGGGGGVGDDATVESASSSILAVGDEPSRSNTPFRRGVLHRAKTAGYSHALELNDESEEPSRSNTPLRRGMLHRATTAGYTKRGYDVFEALESRGSASGDVADDDIRRAAKSPLSLNAIPELSRSSSDATARVPKSAITSRSDSGIEGYRVAIRDGTLAKTKEIYFCGIIDFLQYYNAKKMGETVIKKMSSSEDISCVDPETYGNRFFKFISSLIEKE
ncbi:hypothetical protein ACHAW5_010805 [Stephanodiscus triporus]|uniref:PIPK domain-containing protein n=1 Tax=Stephanodiscus triporus TaxID=2934178 RepID=A0ABD3NQY4_9STRA